MLFIVYRESTGMLLGKEKEAFMCFVDLEKAFNGVPRRVIEWALRRQNVPESLVWALMSLYKSFTAAICNVLDVIRIKKERCSIRTILCRRSCANGRNDGGIRNII